MLFCKLDNVSKNCLSRHSVLVFLTNHCYTTTKPKQECVLGEPPLETAPNSLSVLQKLINNSMNYEGVFMCDKTHLNLYRTFASIFLAYLY